MFQLKKKVTAAILAAAMAMGLLAGCNSNAGTTTTASAGEGTQSEGSSTDSKEREKIVIALAQNTNVESYDENYLTKLLEEELNVDIEFYYLPANADDAKTKFATMVNGGGTLPDVVIGMGYSVLEAADYGSKGIFIRLNDYLSDQQTAKHFNEIPTEDKEYILENITAADGNIYALPKYNTEDWNTTPFRFWINKTWLDAVGAETPKTTEEFQAVMEQFLNEDPNGNGQADEIPITGSTNGWGCNPFYFIMNSFVYCADDSGSLLTLSEDGKTVVAPFTTDEYKAGLEYMNALCEAGIFSPTVFTQDATQMTAVLSNETQIVGSVAAGGYGYWSNSDKNPNFQDMELLAPLTGPDGISYAMYIAPKPSMEYMITKDCKNPELAFKLGDLFYRSDISITNRFGEEGADWSADPEVTKNYKGVYEEVSGIPCTFALLNNIWSKPQSKMWYDAGPTYRGLDFYRGMDEQKPEDANATNYYALTRAQSAAFYADAHPEYILPNLIYTQEEADEVAEIISNVKTYIRECNAAFVTGNMGISEWDTYLKELDNMGLGRWIEIAQTAYERMTK